MARSSLELDEMRGYLSTLLAFALLPACVDEAGYPGDDADDEAVTGGKADGWGDDAPQGTFSFADAATGEIAKLTLSANKTFRREVKGSVAVEGQYELTQGGGNNYIRFLEPNGMLLDRYGFELHGRRLSVRKVDTPDWQQLVAEDNFGAVQNEYAGTYTASGRASLSDGRMFELMLHDTGRFYMAVKGTHACHDPGHACPDSWSDGIPASTHLFGTWAPKAGGVTLTPRTEITGQEGSRIDLAMNISGASLQVNGTDGSLQLAGPMDVRARFSRPHSVEQSSLSGTWKVAKVVADPDATISLWGSAFIYIGYAHEATFDSETNEFCERSPNASSANYCGIYQVAGDPAGGTRGVLYAYHGTKFTALTIKSQSASKIELANNEGRVFTLTRE